MPVAVPMETREEMASAVDPDAGPEVYGGYCGLDLSGLSDDRLVELMTAVHRQAAVVQALEVAAVAELARRREAEAHGAGASPAQADEFITDEIALALTVTSAAAADLVHIGVLLAGRLPWTRAAFGAGLIDLPKVKVIVRALAGVPVQAARAAEAAVIAEAPGLTTGQLRGRIRKALVAVDPQAAERRRDEALGGRCLDARDNPDGTADLAARCLPADRVGAIWNRISAAATAMKTDGDARPIDAIRADLAMDLLQGVPLPQAATALITEPIPADPDADPAPGHDAGAGPAEDIRGMGAGPAETPTRTSEAPVVEGQSGPVSGAAGLARTDQIPEDTATIRLIEHRVGDVIAQATDERLTRLWVLARTTGRDSRLHEMISQATTAITAGLAPIAARWCQAAETTARPGPTGPEDPDEPERHGHAGYRPPAWLRRLIEQRHRTCVFPTCNRRAATCDLDHTIPWQQGGSTCPCNLAPLCRHHHRLKQHRNWLLTQPWPGLLIWVTPAGQWHIVKPETNTDPENLPKPTTAMPAAENRPPEDGTPADHSPASRPMADGFSPGETLRSVV